MTVDDLARAVAFLAAGAGDWPQELYRKLGFDEIGWYVKFVRPG